MLTLGIHIEEPRIRSYRLKQTNLVALKRPASAPAPLRQRPSAKTMEEAVQKAKSQADRDELLIWAAARGLLADAVELLAQGADAGTRDKRGLTPAHYVSAHGHLDVLQYLTAKGVDLDAEDERARSPLHYAALGRSTEVLRFLATKSAWLDGNDAADDTPLHLASRRGWLAGASLLLAGGAKHGARNKRGLTPLGEAVAGGHTDTAKHLISAGADVACGAGGGYSLLHVAAGLGHARCVKLLLDAGADPAPAGDDGATALHAAAMGGSVECAEALLAAGADPLAAAADGRLPSECADAAAPLAAETLRAALRKAEDRARKGGRAPAPARPARPAPAAAAPAPVDAGGPPHEAYAHMFERLPPQEQERRVDGFARMAEAETAGLDFLRPEAKEAVGQVRRALQLLACVRAVAAIHRDERFQEDAADPRVHAAIAEVRETNSAEKYARDGQVASVLGKLRKLQAVLRDSGGLRLGIDELVPPGGAAGLQAAIADDAQRISELEAAHAAARAAAIDALLGQPAGSAAARARAPNPARRCGAAGAGGGVMRVDAAAGEDSQDGGGGVVAGGGGVDDEEEPLWKRQLRQAAKDTAHRIIRITLAFAFLLGVMWLCNMLPSQQEDSPEFQARLDAVRAAAAARRAAAEAAAGAGGGHVEL
ncbi:MAG: ankyrin repeat-containing domain protein [Monoraphidium minutum]|nr:MAG: ankyrin repeat-containing domain protein [Monoraphidium minutum]